MAPTIPFLPGSFPTAGGVVHDPYFGLRDAAPALLEQVFSAEDQHLRDSVDSDLAQEVYDEAVARLDSSDHCSFPVYSNGFLCFSRTRAGQDRAQHFIAPPDSPISDILRAKDIPGAVCVLDENVLAGSAVAYDLGDWAVDPSGQVLFTQCLDGTERYELYREDRVLAKDVAPSFCLMPSGEVVVLDLDELNRPYQVRVLDSDRVLLSEPRSSRWLSVDMSWDHAQLVVYSASHDDTDLHVFSDSLDLLLSRPGSEHLSYSSFHAHAALTHDASDGTSWVSDPFTGEVLVPSRPGVQVLSAFRNADVLLVCVRREGQVFVEDWSSSTPVKLTGEVPGEDVEIAHVHARSGQVFAHASSWTDLPAFYAVNGTRLCLLYRERVPGYFPGEYSARRLSVAARDGVAVPVTVVSKKGTGPCAPALVYAYGAYGVSLDPWFSASRVSLLDRGFVFVVAHVRGGGENGRIWHEAGRLGRKMNTFTDLVDVVEALRSAQVVDRVVLRGGSAGGATVSTAALLYPQEFSGVVAEVPFVDALATMSDASLPLTVGEYSEWGDPSTPSGFEYISRWSSVDLARSCERLPDFLICVGVNDPRVGFWEGLKLAAYARAGHSSNRVLVRVDRGSGHQGASGKYDSLREESVVLSWVMSVLS